MVPQKSPQAWREIGCLGALLEPPEREKPLLKKYKEIVCVLTKPRTNHENFLLEIRGPRVQVTFLSSCISS